MSRTLSPVSGKPWCAGSGGCRVPPSAATGFRNWPLRRSVRGPVGRMADAALLEQIPHRPGASPFHGEGHRKVWARLHPFSQVCAGIERHRGRLA